MQRHAIYTVDALQKPVEFYDGNCGGTCRGAYRWYIREVTIQKMERNFYNLRKFSNVQHPNKSEYHIQNQNPEKKNNYLLFLTEIGREQYENNWTGKKNLVVIIAYIL